MKALVCCTTQHLSALLSTHPHTTPSHPPMYMHDTHSPSLGDRSEMSHRDGQRGGGLGMGALITILRRIYGETVFLGCIAGR